MSRSVLITSASGTIGSHLIPHLLSNPITSTYKLILPTRSANKLAALLPTPLPSTITIAEGNTSNALWLETLLSTHAVDTVFSNFAGMEELMYTLNLWSACAATGVKHVIFLSAAGDMSPDAIKHGGLLKDAYAAHVLHKPILEQKLMYGGVPFTWTVLGPTLFFTNDWRSKEFLLGEGYFNEPFGEKGVSRVDPDDIGLAGARAIEDGGRRWAGRKVAVGSREMWTAEMTARVWGQALGRNITAAGQRQEEYRKLEQTFSHNLGPAFGRDLMLMYKQFEAQGFGMSEEDYKLQVELLGKEPSRYEEFVKKTAAAWKADS